MSMTPMSIDKYPLGTFPDYVRLMEGVDKGDPVALYAVEYYQKCARGEVHPRNDPLYRARLIQAAVQGHTGALSVLSSLPPGTAVKLSVTTANIFPAVSTNPVPPESNNRNRFMPPPGVHLTRTRRVGDTIRDEYLVHLDTMFSDGHIDREEFDARADAALKAKTLTELKVLTMDLPDLPLREIPPEKPAAEHHQTLAPLLIAGIFLGSAISGVAVVFMATFLFFALLWIIVFFANVYMNKKVTKE